MSNKMQEIEAKFFVRDLEGISMRLRSLEALLIQPRILETNIRFDLPDGGLRSEGRVLRLRMDTEARLTYKGGSTNEQGVLSRPEIEFVVGDLAKARQFLEALGFQKLFYYEKYRTTYDLADCHIMLDEMPYGYFVEIEGGTVEAIQTAARALNLEWESATPTSYHVLFERLCAKHPELDPSELSFTALEGLNITVEELAIRPGDG